MMAVRRWLLAGAACAGVAVIGVGCADENQRDDSPQVQARDRPEDPPGSSMPGENSTARRQSPGASAPDEETRTLPNGTVIRLPPPARERVVIQSSACSRTEVRRPDGSRQTVMVPPAPGLSAIREADSVKVTVAPGTPPLRCRPIFARIGVDSREDPLPPVWRDVRFRDRRPVQVTIHLPDEIMQADIVLAYGASRSGSGPTARIALAPPN
jgi:hypothetical protein